MPNKIKMTFDFAKLARKIPKIAKDEINVLGNHMNKAIQDGIDQSKDINGNPFAKLSPATKALGGSKPLDRTGTMRKTKKTPAKDSNLSFSIEMVGRSSRTGKIYGQYHNEGYTNSSKAWFPGAKVPKREWFGIPKTFKKGGKELEKAILNIKLRLDKAWRK